MKIKVVCNYDSDINIYNIVNDIWNIDNKYQLTYKDDYDILIIFNSYNYRFIKINKNRVFGFIQEPGWKEYFDRNLPEYCNKVFFHKPEIFTNNNVIKCISILQHHLWNKLERCEIQWKPDNTKNILNSKFVKTKKLSIIIRNFDSHEMYKHRQKLVKDILDSDLDIDIYGAYWNISDNRYKGYLNNKIDGLKDYEYSICLENCNEDSYITEKFTDCILCDTKPIYYGAKDINTYYPNSCIYLDITQDKLVEKIKNIINTDIQLDMNNKYKYIMDYNPFKIIQKYL